MTVITLTLQTPHKKFMSDKTVLRRSLLALRNAIPTELRNHADMQIGLRVRQWLDTHATQTLGIYWPMRGEPDLRGLYNDLAKQGIRLALPVVVQPDAPLEFYVWEPGEHLVKDALGISIPAKRMTAQPDALLVPCLGFNHNNFRLGYGGGFYDRSLANKPRPRTAGIAYQCTLATFEHVSYDIALDAIITEKAIWVQGMQHTVG